jgi:ferritin-like metal-binding protein YciE
LLRDPQELANLKVKENALRELYVNDRKNLFSAENQMVKALPKMT